MFSRSVSWLISIFVASVVASDYSHLPAITGFNAGVRVNSLRSYIPEWSMMGSIQKVKELVGQNLDVVLDVGDSVIVAGDTRVVAHREVLAARRPELAAMPRYNTLETSTHQQVAVPYGQEDPVLRRLLDSLLPLNMAPRMLAPKAEHDHGLAAQQSPDVNSVKHANVDLRKDRLAEVRMQPDDMAQLSQLLSERPAATGAPTATQTRTSLATNQPESNHEPTPATATPSTVVCPSTPIDEDEVSTLRTLSGGQLDEMLIMAAKMGQVEPLRNLLAAGAHLEAKTSSGRTVLHWAARNGHAVAARCLLDVGAAVEATDYDQYRPVHMAAMGGHAAVVRLLAAWGADLDAQDRWGFTPLHLTAKERHPETAQALLDAGANRRIKNESGNTPLDMAKKSEYQEMIDVLTQN